MPWEISKDGTTMKYRPIPFRLNRPNRELLIRAAIVNAALEQFPGTVKEMGLGGALWWHAGFGSGMGRTFRDAIRRHFFALLEATTNV